jgi:S1-C subfamily serine protease
MKCPKCGYERQAADNAPDGECPSCGIVYAKYKPPNQLTIPHDNPSDILEKRYKAILGEINQEYYLTKFKQFDQQGTGLKRSWNWPAFFFHVNWFLYRKMYGLFFIFFFSVSIIFAPIDMLARIAIEKSLWGGFLMLPILLIPQLFYGIFGNSLYHKHIKKKIAAAQLTIKDEARLLEHIGRGVNKWVIWVVGWAIIILAVIGILAAIIIPQFSTNSSKQTENQQSSTSVSANGEYDDVFGVNTGGSKNQNPFDQFDKKPATEQIVSKTNSPAQSSKVATQNGTPPTTLTSPIEHARNATVSIETPWGVGSGFFVKENYIVTNKHVVETNEEELAKVLPRPEQEDKQLKNLEKHIQPGDIKIITANGSRYTANHIVVSQKHDLALLSLYASEQSLLQRSVGNAAIQQGDKVYTIGNSVGLRNTVTAGIFSGYRKRESDGALLLQVDAPINPGNSGGPLIDEKGYVLGVNSMILRNTQGIGLAIPIETVYEEFQSALQ